VSEGVAGATGPVMPVYISDALVFRSLRPLMAIEVLHSHKTEMEKIECSKRHSIQVFEVTTSEVLSALPKLEQAVLCGASVNLTNLLMKVHVSCSRCDSLHLYDDETNYDSYQYAACELRFQEREYGHLLYFPTCEI
jgi:hypothetical protein